MLLGAELGVPAAEELGSDEDRGVSSLDEVHVKVVGCSLLSGAAAIASLAPFWCVETGASDVSDAGVHVEDKEGRDGGPAGQIWVKMHLFCFVLW